MMEGGDFLLLKHRSVVERYRGAREPAAEQA
jgi:hypothetical protein